MYLSKNGYLKFQDATEYKAQHRGGKGRGIIAYTDFADSIHDFTIDLNFNTLFCFSNIGNLYLLNLQKVNLSKKMSRGIAVSTFFKLKKNEKIDIIRTFEKNNIDERYLVLITQKGLIKITPFNNFEKIRSSGIKVIKLLSDDRVIDAKIINKNDDLMVFANNGRAIKFSSKNIRITSRYSRGIKSVRLNKNEYVIGLIIPDNNYYILSSTEHAFGKLTQFKDYPKSNKGRKGIICHKINKKTGNLVSVEKVLIDKYLFIMTTNGIMSKIKINEIPCLGRYAKGVYLMRLKYNEKIIKIKYDL